jgi:hypothetical protein
VGGALEVVEKPWPFSSNRSTSEKFGFTGGLRFWICGLGDKDATGGRIDGVAEPRLPLDVVGLGGECFVGEMPVLAGGSADARLGSWFCGARGSCVVVGAV